MQRPRHAALRAVTWLTIPAVILAGCTPLSARFGGPKAAEVTGPSPRDAARRAAADVPTGFPLRCAPGEVQVMLLGTYRFAGNGGDAVRQSPDDVLSARRQEELQELAARLADWAPQQVVVAWPLGLADSTSARYRRFVAGSLGANRHEMVQVGFRVAKRLTLDDVQGFDQARPAADDSVNALFRRRPDLQRPLDEALRSLEREADSVVAWRRNSTISEHLMALNADEALHRGNSYGMFAGYLGAGDGGNAGGVDVLAAWYARNLHMAHNLTRVVRPGTRRVLAVVGAEHVPPLRHLLDEAPQFCPVSALPFLR